MLHLLYRETDRLAALCSALLSILSVTLPTTYLLSSIYPPTSLPLPGPLSLLVSPASAPPPADPNSEAGKQAMQALEAALDDLPVVQQMRSVARAGHGWYETRPHSAGQPSPHSLTASVLRGPSKLAVRPLIFAREDESEAVVILHLGRSLCGHDGIIHGGMIATIFDESLARNVGVARCVPLGMADPPKPPGPAQPALENRRDRHPLHLVQEADQG